MAFMKEVPEALEDAVIIHHDFDQTVHVCWEECGQTVGLRGAVQRGPWRAEVGFWGPFVGKSQVENKGLVIQNHATAAWVVSIHVINTISWP